MSTASVESRLAWGDLPGAGKLSRLMHASWGEGSALVLDYSPEALEWYLHYPGDLPVISPALYCEEELAAFVIGMPRRAEIEGDLKHLLLMTGFTVSNKYKGRGLGARVWAECLKRAQEGGYDGAFHYCVEGNVSNLATAAGTKRAGFQMHRIWQVKYLIRLLQASQTEARQERDFSIDGFLQAADLATRAAGLRRLWTRADVEWHYRARPGGFCFSPTNSAGAVIAGHLQPAAPSSTSALLLDDLFLTGSEAEQEKAITDFVAQPQPDAAMAVLPVLGYASVAPFKAAGFRLSRQVVNAYLTLWNGTVPAGVKAIYMDVL